MEISKEKLIYTKKGITLISLVVTIIILLILAGITINLLLTEGGLFDRAQQSQEEHEKGAAREKLDLKLADMLIEKISNSEYNENEYLTNQLQNSGFEVNENKVTVDGYMFEIDRSIPKIVEEGEKVDKIPSLTKIANAPDTTGFNKNNSYYVTWNSSVNENSEYTINENTNLNESAPSDWYDYTAGINKWANIKTTGGNNNCYWVWIPRYAYCITEGYHTSTAQTIDVVFLEGTTNEPIDKNVSIEIKNESGAGNWNVSPAFWWDENNDEIRTEDEELSGIWVAKFEASSSSENVVENPSASQLAIDGGSDADTDLQVRVIPNVTSWRNITVNNIFTVCQNLTTSGNSLVGTTNIDSHMLKNSEWGAVAYLSRSVYGKNNAVWNNPYYNNTTNYSNITGLCGNSQNASQTTLNYTEDTNKLFKYNTIGGENASTTGNVYGIYDMAGGAWEYVSGYLSEITSSNTNFSKLGETSNNKYVDKYAGSSNTNTTNYSYNADKYGDAIYEISSSGANDSTMSWDLDYSSFVNSSNPVLSRGSRAGHSDRAGIFAFNDDSGRSSAHFSFRPCLVIPLS